MTCIMYTVEAENIQLKISSLRFSDNWKWPMDKALLTHSYLINNINDNNYA